MKRANAGHLVACFILILSLVLGMGCGLLPTTDTSTSSPTSTSTATSTSIPIDPNWTLPRSQDELPLLPTIADVVAKVKPSVVAIDTEVVTYDIFSRPSTEQGAGSGWIINEDGIIVTNNHVVQGAETVTVTLSDDRVFTAETIRTDTLSDLAVVKINARNLPAAPVGDSSRLRVGDWVVTIGNPLGLGISAKEGIVSRLNVPLSVSSGQTLYDLIETSAAINPGNSGGPLVNMAGEVIGITSAKIATVGVEGLGYAININASVPIIEELVTAGYVVWPWLGVVLYTVDQGLALRYGLAVDKGALVTEIAQNSPVDKAGIKPGDVIVTFGDKEITSQEDLIQAIHSSQIGTGIEITFWRGDSKNTTTAVLIERPPSP
jgi:serine protease Do